MFIYTKTVNLVFLHTLEQNDKESNVSARIHCLGFGGQGSVWANCLRKSGWNVSVYLPKEGSSFQKAKKQRFDVYPLEMLPKKLSVEPRDFPMHVVAMLCPDFLIGKMYRELLASIDQDMTLILAHGYAVYAEDLKVLNPKHELMLFAPKVIGPYMEMGFLKNHPASHSFKAATYVREDASVKTKSFLKTLSHGLGFKEENLIPATFEQEAVGDLISEQGLLCGTFFPFLNWTAQEMKKAGVPEKLIHEECLSELVFIASILQKLGPSQTFSKISAAAKAGTVFMKERLEEIGAKQELSKQVQEVLTRKFVERINKENWQKKVSTFEEELNS